MTYDRLVRRNRLTGDYEHLAEGLCAWPGCHDAACTCQEQMVQTRTLIAGDLRRLEQDQRDEKHLATYAQIAGITPEQAKKVLDAFFGR